MTQDEIIKLARKVGMIKDGEWWFSSFYKTEQDVHISHLEAFAKLVAKQEREACAKIVEESSLPDTYSQECLPEIANDIRARGQA